MKDNLESRVSPQLLAAYVDGDVAPSEAAAVERALAESPALRRRADGLRHIKDVLSSPIRSLDQIDLTGRLKVALEREQRAMATDRSPVAGARRPSLLRTLMAGAAALATCAVGVGAVVLMRAPGLDDGEFRAKSAAPAALDSAQSARRPGAAPGLPAVATRWAGVSVYHVAGDEAPAPLSERLPMGHGLLFSYTNAGPDPFDFLAIFAVDSTQQVRWFFPAHEQPGTNPGSIPIQKGGVNLALTELLHHELPRGPLLVHAVFSRHQLRVWEVEAWLKAHPDAASLPWPDARQQVIITSVE